MGTRRLIFEKNLKKGLGLDYVGAAFLPYGKRRRFGPGYLLKEGFELEFEGKRG